MNSLMRSWFQRKIANYRALKERKRAAEIWKCMAARYHYAGVTIAASPAREFSFESRVKWPTNSSEGETAVLDGLLDALTSMPTQDGSVLGGAFVLESIDWREEGATTLAFYMAARKAGETILKDNISGQFRTPPA